METWKSILGWEGLYEASSDGRIRSIVRKSVIPLSTGGIRPYGGGVVRSFKKNNGYLYVNLTKHGKRQQEGVHRLVLLAFNGTPAQRQECCHNNGKRDDNRIENLRWDTRANNHADKWKHGTAQWTPERRARRERKGKMASVAL